MLCRYPRQQNLPPERWMAGLDPAKVSAKDVQISAGTPMILA